jgi:hypothetical protein
MYECHITIAPLIAQHRPLVMDGCLHYRFKLAKLLKENRSESDLDSFMTGHGDFEELQLRMEGLIRLLCSANIEVYRYKIEKIVIDSRNNDYLKLTTKAKDAKISRAQPAHWVEAAIPFA